jgi:hypothetical protein
MRIDDRRTHRQTNVGPGSASFGHSTMVAGPNNFGKTMRLWAKATARMRSDMMSDQAETSGPETVKGLLDVLKRTVNDICHATIHEEGIYGCALRASIAKSFEFASLSYQEPPPAHGFFITATLRGICEDLIAFTLARSNLKCNTFLV